MSESEDPKVPCLFYPGQMCGVVRSTVGRRLYHFECVASAVRDVELAKTMGEVLG